MFCTKCGAKNPDNSSFCSVCGNQLSSTITTTEEQKKENSQVPQQINLIVPQQPAPASTSTSVPGMGLGIAGMVLGICSILFFCLTWIDVIIGIVGLVLSAVSYSMAKKAGKKNGMAVAGIACSLIGITIALLYFILIVFEIVNTTTSVSSGSRF